MSICVYARKVTRLNRSSKRINGEIDKSVAGETAGIYLPFRLWDNNPNLGRGPVQDFVARSQAEARQPERWCYRAHFPDSATITTRRTVMKTNLVRSLLALGAVLAASLAPLQAHAAFCSNAAMAGNWAYTYSGTIFTPAGPLPAASVGHFHLDAAGNVNGSQSRTVAGQFGAEDIAGTISVNSDCSASATINVLVDGQLQRTAELALIFDSSGNHLRAIFQSLTLPGGTNVPVVLTIDANRVVLKN
jgi:hypothetical protein